jgi:hypothetical protein
MLIMLINFQIGGLQVRVGCEAFFLLVKNNPETPFDLVTLWTNKGLEEFMSVIV